MPENKVIFFPHKFDIGMIERAQFKRLQEGIQKHIDDYMFNIKDFSQFWRVIKKEQMHGLIRSRWQVIDGGKCE